MDIPISDLAFAFVAALAAAIVRKPYLFIKAIAGHKKWVAVVNPSFINFPLQLKPIQQYHQILLITFLIVLEPLLRLYLIMFWLRHHHNKYKNK